jgi:hypothetical protein
MLEAQPYARTLFAQLARPLIIPAGAHNEGLRLIFDLESDGLLEVVTRVHCIVIGELDRDCVYEYGPERIADALEHLARADVLIGHNIQSYDLPVLRKLHEWVPRHKCRVVDTLIAGRLILPNLTNLDGEVAKRVKDKAFGKIYGKYSLEAWGVRLGVAKIGTELEDWSKWSPEIEARCVRDVGISKRLWQFLQPDGYPRAALDLEHAVAAICDRITADGAPFDSAAAAQLLEEWETRRAELEAQLLAQFPTVKNLNSRIQIAALLEARGWQPEKRTEKTRQPVIDDTLLDSLPVTYPEFTGLAEHFILGRRLGQLANASERGLATSGRTAASMAASSTSAHRTAAPSTWSPTWRRYRTTRRAHPSRPNAVLCFAILAIGYSSPVIRRIFKTADLHITSRPMTGAPMRGPLPTEWISTGGLRLPLAWSQKRPSATRAAKSTPRFVRERRPSATHSCSAPVTYALDRSSRTLCER